MTEHDTTVPRELPGGTPGESDEPTDPMGPTRAGVAFNVGVTVLDVGVALLAFSLARHNGASNATAYLTGCVGPLLGALAVWRRSRELSGASMAILGFTALSAVVAVLGSHSGDALLYKDALSTGVIGVIFATSLRFRRPLAFHFGQRYATDGTREQMQIWAGQWRYQRFRQANYAITAIWAAACLLDASLKGWIIATTDFNTAYVWTQVLPLAATIIATLLTIAAVRHYSADR